MSLKVEIESLAVHVKEGLSTKTGKPYKLREQSGFIFTIDRDGRQMKYPSSFKFLLQGESAPFPLGVYTLDLSSLYVDRFGNLALGDVRLKPLPQAAKAAA